MTQQTDYQQLEHPVPNSESEEDKGQWAPVLDTLFEDGVDELLIKRGALTDRPPAGSSKDVADYPRLYLATDQTPPLLSIDNDTEWIDVNPFDDSVREATKTFGGSIVNGGHSDFSSAQAAIDFADTNDYTTVKYPSGTYGAITIPQDVHVTGATSTLDGTVVFEDAVSSGAVVTISTRSRLSLCAVENTSTGSSDNAIAAGFEATVHECNIRGAGGDGVITNDANEVLVTHCIHQGGTIGGSTVNVTANSSDCIITENRNIGTITNNGGSSNIVTNNT